MWPASIYVMWAEARRDICSFWTLFSPPCWVDYYWKKITYILGKTGKKCEKWNGLHKIVVIMGKYLLFKTLSLMFL